MSASATEAALAALAATLAGIAGWDFARSDPLPEEIDAVPVARLYDGDAGEPEVTLSPARWHWSRRTVLELAVPGDTPAARDAAFDALVQAVEGALAADRTLGGAVDWAEADAPETNELHELQAAALKSASLPIVLEYVSTSRAG